jgi:hypothetical protein
MVLTTNAQRKRYLALLKKAARYNSTGMSNFGGELISYGHNRRVAGALIPYGSQRNAAGKLKKKKRGMKKKKAGKLHGIKRVKVSMKIGAYVNLSSGKRYRYHIGDAESRARAKRRAMAAHKVMKKKSMKSKKVHKKKGGAKKKAHKKKGSGRAY